VAWVVSDDTIRGRDEWSSRKIRVGVITTWWHRKHSDGALGDLSLSWMVGEMRVRRALGVSSLLRVRSATDSRPSLSPTVSARRTANHETVTKVALGPEAFFVSIDTRHGYSDWKTNFGGLHLRKKRKQARNCAVKRGISAQTVRDVSVCEHDAKLMGAANMRVTQCG